MKFYRIYYDSYGELNPNIGDWINFSGADHLTANYYEEFLEDIDSFNTNERKIIGIIIYETEFYHKDPVQVLKFFSIEKIKQLKSLI